MNLYLAGWNLDKKKALIEESKMNVYLAGNIGDEKWRNYNVSVLESAYYVTPKIEKLIPHFPNFLLDSGAFTFFSSGKKVDWLEYVDYYCDLINRTDVKLFFELDIDSLVGLPNVIKLRKEIEKQTNKQPIPVFHLSRGISQFKRDCDEYPYVALGGIVSGEWSKTQQSKFPWFINEAHARGAKIHGLGYTSLEGLKKYHFDSVDSTAWTTGNRFGYVYKFENGTMKQIPIPKGKRMITNAVAQNNFDEWVKFQKYAEVHL